MNECILARPSIARRCFCLFVGGTALAMVCLMTQAPAQARAVTDQAVASRPCPRTDDLDFDAASDVHAFDEYANAIAALLKDEQFAQLDCIANSARSTRARFTGGSLKLVKFYNGVEEPRPGHPTEEDWKDHLRHVERWVASNPESITARVALAKSYVDYGWSARGNGYGDTVSESGWKLFGERLEKAKDILDRASSLKEKCPEWYVAMQQIARGQGWDAARQEKLYQDAIALDPSFEVFYRLRAVDLLPKWGGQDGDTSRFAAQVADHIGGNAGDILYFVIATEVVCACTEPEFNRMSWPRLQKGFALSRSTYGASLAGWNIFALMAIKNNDAVTADAAFQHIGEHWNQAIWITEKWFQQQKSWAARIAPLELRSGTIKLEARANVQSPEWSAYKKDFDARMTPLEQACFQRFGSDLESFELMVQLGQGGTVKDLYMPHPTNVAMCLIERLGFAKMKDEIMFSPPPRDAYWVAIQIDPAASRSAAK